MTRFLRFSAWWFLLVIGGLLLFPSSAQAQLQEVKQTVFGMDCAPCAHAMETRLGNTDGVSSVTVSLNEGLATLELEPGNALTLSSIREAVVQGGFQPKDATVRVTGVVTEQDGRRVLSIEAGETYVLEPTDESTDVQEVEPGTKVTVTGRVAADAPEDSPGWRIEVQEATPVG